MDSGAPSPIILSNDNDLFVAFYVDMDDLFSVPQERNVIYDTGIFSLKFKSFLKYTFGMPGNETIQGHPYAKLGMRSYSFYELKDSDLIKSLQDIDRFHPYYDGRKWKKYKHYIITFHDNMFECIAQDFSLEKKTPHFITGQK